MDLPTGLSVQKQQNTKLHSEASSLGCKGTLKYHICVWFRWRTWHRSSAASALGAAPHNVLEWLHDNAIAALARAWHRSRNHVER